MGITHRPAIPWVSPEADRPADGTHPPEGSGTQCLNPLRDEDPVITMNN